MEKEVFSHCESWMVAALSFPEKHTGSFFSSLQQVWLSFLIFWKQQAACHFYFFLGCHQTVVLPKQSDNRYGRQQSQNTLPLNLYSWNGTTFPRGLFAQFWNCRKTCFCEPGNWHLMEKDVFSHCKSWRLAATRQAKRGGCDAAH